MNEKQIAREKQNAELMVLDALQNLTKATGLTVRSIHFDFKPEPDGKQREFARVSIDLDTGPK